MEDPRNDVEVMQVYYFVQMLFCLLSIIGCFVAMVCILIVWRSSKILIKIIFWIVLTQFVVCFIGFLSAPAIGVDFTTSHALCMAQGLTMIFFEKVSLMWVSVMSFCMLLIARGTPEIDLNRFHLLFHVICLAIPAALSFPYYKYIVPIQSYTEILTRWCIVGGDKTIPSFMIPLLILFLFNIVCIIYIIIKFTTNYKETQEVYTKLLATRSRPRIRKFFLRLILIPIFFVFCFSGDVIYRLLLVLGDRKSIHHFLLFMCEATWLQGFFFSLTYLGKKRFIRRLFRVCCKPKRETSHYSFS